MGTLKDLGDWFNDKSNEAISSTWSNAANGTWTEEDDKALEKGRILGEVAEVFREKDRSK